MPIGGPLWSPGGGVIVFLRDSSQGHRTRATIKAHTAPRLPPSPLRLLIAIGDYDGVLPAHLFSGGGTDAKLSQSRRIVSGGAIRVEPPDRGTGGGVRGRAVQAQ